MKKIRCLIIILISIFIFTQKIEAGYCVDADYAGVNSNHECYLLVNWQANYTDESDTQYNYGNVNGEACGKTIFNPIQLYCKNISYNNYYSNAKSGHELLSTEDAYSQIYTDSNVTIRLDYGVGAIDGHESDMINFIGHDFNTNGLQYYASQNANCGNVHVDLVNRDNNAISVFFDGTIGVSGEYFGTKESFFREKGIENGMRNGDVCQEVNTSNNTSSSNSSNSSCDGLSVDRIKACACIPAGIADLTSKAYFILQIIGPVLLLILGGFEMTKALSTQDESAIEKAKKKLVNKFIAAAAIFLIFTIIQFMVNLLAKNAEGIIECVDILLNGYVI